MEGGLIGIIDYGVGNVRSILNMFKKIGVPAAVTRTPQDMEEASAFLLPGVGSFDHAMRNLLDTKLVPPLTEHVFGGNKPLLGICLGMQLLTSGSEEGSLPGLDWIPDSRTVAFGFSGGADDPRVPHMGWNTVRVLRDDGLFDGLDDARFYFLHSFHVISDDPKTRLAGTSYGYEFLSSVGSGHIRGVQFHPEKSHRFGMRLLTNFASSIP